MRQWINDGFFSWGSFEVQIGKFVFKLGENNVGLVIDVEENNVETEKVEDKNNHYVSSCAPVCNDDVMIGTDAKDTFRGKCGNDVLVGARGADKLFGGRGDDYITGNQGRDKMWGGKGEDVFVFDGDFDKDIVMDFNPNDDMLQFILYQECQQDWTAETILDFAVQKGNHVVIRLPDSNEVARIKHTDLAELTEDHFDVIFYQEPEVFV